MKQRLARISNAPLGQRGFSMIFVLVIMVVVVLSVLFTMQYTVFSSQAAERTISMAYFQLLNQQLVSIFRDDQSCQIALGADTLTPQAFGRAVNSVSDVVVYNQAGGKFLDPADPAASWFGQLRITQLQLKNEGLVGGADPDLYKASLIIRGNRAGSTLLSNNVSQIVWLSVRLDATDSIVECTSNYFYRPGVNTPVPMPICNADQVLFSDGNDIRCVQVYCLPPRVQTGWQPDGNISCI